jgi:hypothetical protein
MNQITFISTIHIEMGKCNDNELCKIIENISPEVIFLEAIDETYTSYDKYLFKSFGIFHKKLEVSAIQKYTVKIPVEYIPVLDKGLSAAFDTKYKMVSENSELQRLIDNFNFLVFHNGFKFLNSAESIKLQDEMRALESRLLNGNQVETIANLENDTYENSMIRNIYNYCQKNVFHSAIFMCGVAHRKSIIEKIEK